jgi:hypothetical protein
LKWDTLHRDFSNLITTVRGHRTIGSICIQVPLNVNDIQQCREKLGRYTKDPDKFTAGIQTLPLGFDLSCKDGQLLLANCCTPVESSHYHL